MSAAPAPLLALAGRGLPGAPPPTAVPHDLLDEVEAQGLTGALLAAAALDQLALAPADRTRAEARRDAEAQLAVRLEAELLRLAPVLERHAGVVLKGPALAHHAAADPGERPFSDLDLLVHPRSIPLVLRDLARLGYERPRPDPAPGFAALVAKATTVVHPTGLLVDLHRTITLGAAGEGVDVDEILAGRIELHAGPVAFPAPSWPAHLVIVALHAAVGDGLRRPRSLRDVVHVAHHHEQDPAEALAMADRWGVRGPVAAALRAATEQLGAVLPAPLARVADEAPHLRLAPASRHRVEQLRGGRDLRSRAALARALVAPTPTFLRWSYGELPLPQLYTRRWRDLRERGLDAVDGSQP